MSVVRHGVDCMSDGCPCIDCSERGHCKTEHSHPFECKKYNKHKKQLVTSWSNLIVATKP
jgi:Ni,Fe-hydrogenase I small subunit